MNSNILVYCHNLTPRVKYVFQFVFRDVLQIKIDFTSSKSAFESSTENKISYSYQPLSSGVNFVPHGLLFEKGIEQFNVNVENIDSNIQFFKVTNSAISFDIFSAVFYLITRYEEYLPHVKDKHGRFAAEHSIAYKEGFLIKPIVDIWIGELKALLQFNFKEIKFPERKFTPVATIDVDSAYAYKEKGFVRTIAGVFKDIVRADFTGLKNRLKTIVGLSMDPFDVFDRLIEYQKQLEQKFIFFFLVGDYDKNDKSIPISSKQFQALLKHVNDYSEVGVHPSFASNEDDSKLRNEVRRISDVLHFPITKSRQHFLMLNLPSTYRNLINLEISDDYSMGYPDHSGFRASTCTPYFFYDLETETETQLRVHPFCFMEATYKYYHPASPEEVIQTAVSLAKEVKAVNGVFNFVWHSDSLSGMEPWQGWERTFPQFLHELKNL